MARTFDGTTYVSGSSTLLSNEPICFFCWANPDNITTSYVVMALGNNGATGSYSLQFAGAVASDPVRALKDNDAGSGAVIAATSSGYTAAWYAAAAQFGSDTSRDAFLSGANKGSNTTSRTDPTPDFVAIGTLLRNAASQTFSGDVAEAFILDVIPTDTQHTLLAMGIHPLYAGIPAVNIRGWYPLLGDDNNRMGGGYPNLSQTGSPTFSSHPPLVIPPRLGSRCSM